MVDGGFRSWLGCWPLLVRQFVDKVTSLFAFEARERAEVRSSFGMMYDSLVQLLYSSKPLAFLLSLSIARC